MNVPANTKKTLGLVGVGHEGGTCVPGAVEELTAGAVGKRELDGFVTHLERAAFGAGHEFFARVSFDPGENLVDGGREHGLKSGIG